MGYQKGCTPAQKGNGKTYQWLMTIINFSSDECLIFPFHKPDRDGRIFFSHNGKFGPVRAFVCEKAHGPRPTAKHKAAITCSGKLAGCVNPRHLRWMTMLEVNELRYQNHPKSGAKRYISDEQIELIRSYRGTASFQEIADRVGVGRTVVRYWMGSQESEKNAVKRKRVSLTPENVELFRRLSSRPSGATANDLVRATGALKVTVYRQAKRLGVHLARPQIRRVLRPRILQISHRLLAWRPDGYLLSAIDAIVPRGLDGRDDVCQEIAVAVLSELITLDAIRAGGWRKFKTAFWKENFDQRGHGLLLDAPRFDGTSWHDRLQVGVAEDMSA